MYLYITILLLCMQASRSLSKADGCFYEDFMDGKFSALSDSCPEFADNPWQFETYESAKMNQPSFSTAEGFIGAGELDKQCVTNNFPLSMKQGSELFVAYHATGEAALSVELIDFHTSASVDFIIMDLIYDQWSLDSFTIMETGDFTFKIIAFTPERSTLIIDSVTYVNNITNLDSCMYDDGNDYDFDSVEEPPMNKVESEIDDIKEVADNSQHENTRDADINNNVNIDVVHSEDMYHDSLDIKRFLQDVVNHFGEINGSFEDKNDEVENDNQELENSPIDRDSNIKEDIDNIQQDNDKTQEQIDPNIDNVGIDESKQNDYVQEDMRNLQEINNSAVARKESDSHEDDKDAPEKIKDESQSDTYQDATGEINDESKHVFEHKDVQETEDNSLDVNDDIKGSPDNGNNVSNENKDASEDNTFENEMNEDESVEFKEIPEEFYDINENDIVAPEGEKVYFNSEDDTDEIKEDIEDLQKIVDDEIYNVEVEASNFLKDEKEEIEKIEETDFFKDEKEEMVKNFEDEDVLEDSQPFSEHMPVGAEWVSFLSVVGVVLSIACLLVLGSVLLITRRRAKKFNDYPYYHYEIPTKKSKNDTFPIYSSA